MSLMRGKNKKKFKGGIFSAKIYKKMYESKKSLQSPHLSSNMQYAPTIISQALIRNDRKFDKIGQSDQTLI